ncbi:DUF4168 domain-containing protein [Pseudanabaena yagii]|uniref:DUF4168 domain-containing protein n=1 Tax=Pseudanabaena yagii GIHE-NHR1 TaxID=2722753 RepID=A0ABX1LVE5_9CYAN|nr:DUF4168 domain-containing protein [Pseudanabaena yagii]NMF58769.1 DUF4168 domain-containing protein [Pseudanabaena yagii GIHE-NHR1]
MNMQYQRHSGNLKNNFPKYVADLKRGIGRASLLGLCLAISMIVEPLINRDRSLTFAQTDQSVTQLNNILAQAVFGDDQLTRYASAVNAIENKRLEIFRTAKNNSNWSTVANLAESQQTKVCDISQPPEFLQDLCNQLRSFTEKEIHRRGFTNKEFNQITREQRQNPYLRGLIQAKQMELRKSK